jgi:hypothetical protein
VIQELLERSGGRQTLIQLREEAVARAAAQQDQVPPAMARALGESLARHTELTAMQDLMVAGLQRAFDHAQAEQAVAWYRSPLASRIAQAEVSANEPAAQAAMTAYLQGLQRDPPSPARLRLVERLDRATGGTDTALDLVSAMTRGLARAIAPTLPPERRPRPGELEPIDQQIRREHRQQLGQAIALRMLFANRDVPDADLEEYLAFWESPPGRWAARSTGRAFVQTLGTVMERVGRDLARAMPGKEAPAGR